MGTFTVKKCRNHVKSRCKTCKQKHRCTVKQVICDANVIASAFLEEETSELARDFINCNRQKYRIVITNDILGEVIWALLENIKEEELLEATLIKLKDDLRNLEVKDSMYSQKRFRSLLDEIFACNNLRCHSTDKIDIATAAYLDMPFFTFDKNIRKDEQTINDAISDYKFKIYKFKSNKE